MTSGFLKAACLLTSAVTLMGIVLPNATAGEDERKHPEEVAERPSNAKTETRKWVLRMPQEERVEYRAVANFDGAGIQGASMLYPAPNAVGLLAAIVTHAALAETSKSSQKRRIQGDADKILEPYRGILDGISHKDLMQQALERLSTDITARVADFSEKVSNDWVMEVTPIFFLTPDQRALMLDNSVAIIPPGATSGERNRIGIKVVSYPKNAPDPENFWLAEQGVKIKEESADLFAQSIALALSAASDGTAENTNAFRTIRYLEGGTEKMERAQVISERCDRIMIRNLRGIFMSVPVKPKSGSEGGSMQCNPSPDSPKP